MRKPLVRTFLLWILAGISLPAHAQTVEFGLCNAGKVDVDVFLSTGKDHPQGSAEFMKEYIACIQGK